MPATLLKDADFRRLWTADGFSQFGTRVSLLAIPLLAVTTLGASALQVSVLTTLGYVGFLVVGLPAGAWCDRWRSRPVLIAADVGRMVALGSIPLGAAFGGLTVGWLYAVALPVGVLTVFFDTAHRTYLPALVEPDRLIEANAKLQGNASVAALAAPTVAGALVQTVGAPVTILVDAASYLWSAGWLARIEHREAPRPRPSRRRLSTEIRAGLRFVRTDPILRAMAGTGTVTVLFLSVSNALTVVFLVRVVGVSPAGLGLLSTAGLTGAVLAALTTRRLAARIGSARALLGGSYAISLGALVQPLTTAGPRLACYVAFGFAAAFGIIVINIVQVSFQQAHCPPDLLGRVNATMVFLLRAPAPVGSLAGGVLATAFGVRAALWCAAVGLAVAPAGLMLSPIRRSRELAPAERSP